MVRTAGIVLLLLSLAACNRGTQNTAAIRQGVIDHLAKVGLSVTAMDVSVSKVDFAGNEADATVAITPKGGNPAQGMSMKYHLKQEGGQWQVTGRQDVGGSPHGAGAAMPGAANPHTGGAMPGGATGGAAPAGGGGKMPSPESLPPTGKK